MHKRNDSATKAILIPPNLNPFKIALLIIVNSFSTKRHSVDASQARTLARDDNYDGEQILKGYLFV
jgi:hypothetical protein